MSVLYWLVSILVNLGLQAKDLHEHNDFVRERREEAHYIFLDSRGKERKEFC